MIKKFINNYIILRKYILHNKKYINNNYYSDNIFLIEFNGWQAIHIAFSYLANFFSEKKKCRIVAFDNYYLFKKKKVTFLEKIKWNLGRIFNLKTFGVYSSFGTKNFLEIKYNKFITEKSNKFFKFFYKKEVSLKKLENLRVENIWIGDLIYDSYLKKYSLSTVDLNSKCAVYYQENQSKTHVDVSGHSGDQKIFKQVNHLYTYVCMFVCLVD
jgi:hypothetical protein